MNGIAKMVGIGMLGALGLASCGKVNNVPENKKFVLESGISRKECDSIDNIPCTAGEFTEKWQKAADSVHWSAKMEAAVKKAYFEGAQAVRDSLKHIKP